MMMMKVEMSSAALQIYLLTRSYEMDFTLPPARLVLTFRAKAVRSLRRSSAASVMGMKVTQVSRCLSKIIVQRIDKGELVWLHHCSTVEQWQVANGPVIDEIDTPCNEGANSSDQVVSPLAAVTYQDCSSACITGINDGATLSQASKVKQALQMPTADSLTWSRDRTTINAALTLANATRIFVVPALSHERVALEYLAVLPTSSSGTRNHHYLLAAPEGVGHSGQGYHLRQVRSITSPRDGEADHCPTSFKD